MDYTCFISLDRNNNFFIHKCWLMTGFTLYCFSQALSSFYDLDFYASTFFLSRIVLILDRRQLQSSFFFWYTLCFLRCDIKFCFGRRLLFKTNSFVKQDKYFFVYTGSIFLEDALIFYIGSSFLMDTILFFERSYLFFEQVLSFFLLMAS